MGINQTLTKIKPGCLYKHQDVCLSLIFKEWFVPLGILDKNASKRLTFKHYPPNAGYED